jgi:hypothetical protein
LLNAIHLTKFGREDPTHRHDDGSFVLLT